MSKDIVKRISILKKEQKNCFNCNSVKNLEFCYKCKNYICNNIRYYCSICKRYFCKFCKGFISYNPPNEYPDGHENCLKCDPSNGENGQYVFKINQRL